MRFLLPVLLVAPLAAQAPPLAALVTTEQVQRTADGLTKLVRFQERFVREGDRVWLERVLPEGGPVPEAEAGHRHLDLDVAARFVERRPGGDLHLTFVHRGERTVVDTEPRDHPEVGFHDGWGVLCYLVDPAVVKALSPLARKAPAGARWLERRSAGGYLRVLWSERSQVALAVESGTADGNSSHRTRVALRPLPPRRPWAELEGYRRKDYTDLLD